MFVVSIEWGLSLGGGGRRIGRFHASLTELINQFCGRRVLASASTWTHGEFYRK